MRTYYVAHETQISARWCPKQEGNPKKRGDIYIYIDIYIDIDIYIALLYSTN